MKYYFLALATLVVVVCGCAVDGSQLFPHKDEYHAPPAGLLQRPGPMVDGPGPGVLMHMAPPPAQMFASMSTQVRFIGQPGMQIGWQIGGGYAENQIVSPGRYNFQQGATYRLKLTNLPQREGQAIYPTLQVYPAHPQTDAYLSHNSVPVELTDEDLDQVESNNFVTKVIYLPEPRYQELAIAGVETLVSTRLDPGVDPVAEADRRGTIMLVLRMGNMDLEMPGAGPNGLGNRRGGAVNQVAYQVDGSQGQFQPPMPIAVMPGGMPGVPQPSIMGGYSAPGRPAMNPVAGYGPTPSWGMPITGTPIGLPGPPHLPYGGPASLKSHTVRNLTNQDIPKPVENMLIDVKHEPGQSLPDPVSYIKYKESHPVISEGEASYPAWARP